MYLGAYLPSQRQPTTCPVLADQKLSTSCVPAVPGSHADLCHRKTSYRMRCMTHTVIKNEMFKLKLFILESILGKLIPSCLLVPFSPLKSTEELWTYHSKGDQSLFFQIKYRGTFSRDFGHTCVNIRAAAVVIFTWLS